MPRVEQGRNGGHQASVGDFRAGPGEGKSLLRVERPVPGLQECRRGDLSREFSEQGDLQRHVETRLAFPRQTGRDQFGGLAGIEPAEGSPGYGLNVGRGVEKQSLVGASDFVLRARRHELAQRAEPRSRLGKSRERPTAV